MLLLQLQTNPNYTTAAKAKQVNEIQRTKTTVIVKVKPSNLQEPSSRSKAAYWDLELFLSKGVQNKIDLSSIHL